MVGFGKRMADTQVPEWSTEYVPYKAVEFIQDNNGADWFLYMNPTAPHGPSIDEAFGVDCRSTVDGDFSDPATPGHPGAG